MYSLITGHQSMYLYKAILFTTIPRSIASCWKSNHTLYRNNIFVYGSFSTGKIRMQRKKIKILMIDFSLQKLPHKLFHPMPILKDWMKINELNVAGLEKAFAFTCISTGDIVDSVMLLGLVNGIK